MKRCRIIYFTFEGILLGVFDSQVMAYIDKLQAEYDIDLIAMKSSFANSEAFLSKKQEVESRIRGNAFFPVRIPYIGRASLLIDFFRLKRLLSSYYSDVDKIVIHARGQVGAYLALKLKTAFPTKHLRVIADIRGAAADEMKYNRSKLHDKFLGVLKSQEMEQIEKFACNNADAIFCVSEALKNYLIEKYDIPVDRFTIIPCCVDSQKFYYDSKIRRKKRNKLGINDRFVVTYSGSMEEAWHCPQKLIDVFAHIKKIYPLAFFLILTKQSRIAESLLQQKDIHRDDYTIFSVPHDEVPTYLMAGDLGLLLREKNLLNRVACPVKFSEYLACGLPVLISEGIGDTEEIIQNIKSGFVYEHIDWKEIAKIRLNRLEWAERCVGVVKELFDLEKKVKEIRTIYKSLMI